MATYEYRCERHGMVEEFRPLGTAPAMVACPVCGDEARRVFSVPALRRSNPEIVAAIDRSEKTRDEPEVVTAIPSKGARRPVRWAPNDPRLQRLPRP